MNDVALAQLLVLQPDLRAAIDADFFQAPDRAFGDIQTKRANNLLML
jgi:hypothetical protein